MQCRPGTGAAMRTHYEIALNSWENIKLYALEFGREAKLAIATEGKTIRDFSIALCGNASLEDRIGRYVMAAEFVDGLDSATLRNVEDWLTPSHYTELAKIEAATDHETVLDLMQELVTENPDGSINVKPVTWLRAKRSNEDSEPAEVWHRVFMVVSRALSVAWSELERKGNLATAADRRKVRVLKLAVRLFQAEAADR